MKKRLRITVNGQTYDVEAEILDDHQAGASAATVAAASPVTPVAAATHAKSAVSSSGTPGDVPSPIAGTVVSIAKQEGSSVAVGDVLMVLEAMKMNTEVTSPCAGKIIIIGVTQGQSVEEGQILMTIN